MGVATATVLLSPESGLFTAPPSGRRRSGERRGAAVRTVSGTREILRGVTSEEKVELVRKSIDAWNQRDLETLMSYTTLDVQWEAGGPAAVEQPLYDGRDELARGTEALWETWEEFRLYETDVQDGRGLGALDGAHAAEGWR